MARMTGLPVRSVESTYRNRPGIRIVPEMAEPITTTVADEPATPSTWPMYVIPLPAGCTRSITNPNGAPSGGCNGITADGWGLERRAFWASGLSGTSATTGDGIETGLGVGCFRAQALRNTRDSTNKQSAPN